MSTTFPPPDPGRHRLGGTARPGDRRPAPGVRSLARRRRPRTPHPGPVRRVRRHHRRRGGSMSWEPAPPLVPADPRIGNGSGALRGLPGTATSPAPGLALALCGFGPTMFRGSRSSRSRLTTTSSFASTACSAMSSLPFPSPPAVQGLGAGSPSAWLAVSRPSARGLNTRQDVAPPAVAVSYGGFMALRPSRTASPTP